MFNFTARPVKTEDFTRTNSFVIDGFRTNVIVKRRIAKHTKSEH